LRTHATGTMSAITRGCGAANAMGPPRKNRASRSRVRTLSGYHRGVIEHLPSRWGRRTRRGRDNGNARESEEGSTPRQ
jgi:hypothetical protein